MIIKIIINLLKKINIIEQNIMQLIKSN